MALKPRASDKYSHTKDQTGKSIFVPMMIANMAAGQVSIAVGAKGIILQW